MESNGNEMAYFIIGLSICVLIASYFVNKIDFKPVNKKKHHSHD